MSSQQVRQKSRRRAIGQEQEDHDEDPEQDKDEGQTNYADLKKNNATVSAKHKPGNKGLGARSNRGRRNVDRQSNDHEEGERSQRSRRYLNNQNVPQEQSPNAMEDVDANKKAPEQQQMPASLEDDESRTLSEDNNVAEKDNELNADAVMTEKQGEGDVAQDAPDNAANAK